jgi:predicted lipoprotein with Yx(FWY)xxD motif
MKRLFLIVGVLVAAISTTVGVSSASASHQSSARGTRVAVGNSGLGRILVDGGGRTLYVFAKDKRGKSSCTGKCAAFWPPLIASGRPLASRGVKASLLGTTKRPDGGLQVTYTHHPLYTFVKDVRKGQTNGEEVEAFGAEWYAVSPAGAWIEKADASTATPAPAAGGYDGGNGSGYGY